MNWLTLWIAKKLEPDLKAELIKEKIIEYNTIIRDLKIRLQQSEREVQVGKQGFLPTLCNTCMHQYQPKPQAETIGAYEPPSPTTEGKIAIQGVRQRATMHQVYPKSGDYSQHVNETERKRFETRNLNPTQTDILPKAPRRYSMTRYSGLYPDETAHRTPAFLQE